MNQQTEERRGRLECTPEVYEQFKIFCVRRRLIMFQATSDALLEYMVRREDAERPERRA